MLKFTSLLITGLTLVSSLPLTELLQQENVLSKRGSSVSDYLVKSLPGLDSIDAKYKPEMHAGYIPINTEEKEEYFFWKFSKNQTTSNANNRLIFWFNGGPGCSSLDGALVESGPLQVNSEGKVEYKKGTWLEEGDLVFIDQPGGVGYSETNTYTKELKEIATDMITFVKGYYELFPEDKTKELYLSGESYAGQYIPYFGAKILSEETDVNLKGLLIFNGYIYPDLQSTQLYEFGLENKIVSENDASNIASQISKCEALVKSNQESWASIIKEMESKGEYSGDNNDSGSSSNKIASDECEQLLNQLLQDSQSTKDDGLCVNVYDYTLRDSDCGSSFPPTQQQVTDFLNTASVETSLNLGGKKSWSECDNGMVGQSLVNEVSYPAFFKLPYILSKIKVLLAAGENDIICNIKGLEKMVDTLVWGNNSSPGFSKDVDYKNYQVDGVIYGKIKEEGNLMFAGVSNSSHMVPYSQPEGSRGVIDVFFGDYSNNGDTYQAVSHGDF